jgi:CxxC motif-containing protein (DUF1111 family)
MQKTGTGQLLLTMIAILACGLFHTIQAQSFRASDPGVRDGAPGAGGPIDGLTDDEAEMFVVGLADFSAEEGVDDGVGPRFNFVSCGGCHSQPAIGGTSPAVNPLFRVMEELGFTRNVMPWFITRDGPIREARFQYYANGSRDGGVRNLFVITGHPDAGHCNIKQEDFGTSDDHSNVVFRIPTPLFGAGLIEQILDSTLLANQNADSSRKHALGISGRPNRNGNDGTITRFGWKAQNKSLAIFSAEAYNVEMGITNEGFQQERDETASCQYAPVPNDVTPSVRQIGAIENFANFQRFLAPPMPSRRTPGGAASIHRGRQKFSDIGCNLCHTPELQTRSYTMVAALGDQNVKLFSDLLLHHMGPGLADDVMQGIADPDEFRTAPLWGLGQRIFFLHDGRTTDLIEAIQAHKSEGNARFGPSEANRVIKNFDELSEEDKQALLDFLRSL